MALKKFILDTQKVIKDKTFLTKSKKRLLFLTDYQNRKKYSFSKVNLSFNLFLLTSATIKLLEKLMAGHLAMFMKLSVNQLIPATQPKPINSHWIQTRTYRHCSHERSESFEEFKARQSFSFAAFQ